MVKDGAFPFTFSALSAATVTACRINLPYIVIMPGKTKVSSCNDERVTGYRSFPNLDDSIKSLVYDMDDINIW